MNGCIINTAVQSTSDPVRMNVTMMKENLTTQMIKKKVALLFLFYLLMPHSDLIRLFGMRSGREYSKFDEIEYKTDKQGNPYMGKNTIAYMSLIVRSILDLDTHYLFICDVVEERRLRQDNL